MQTLQKYTLEFEPREQSFGTPRAHESRHIEVAAQLGHLLPVQEHGGGGAS